MSPALATFLFEAANFLVLAGALGWLLFKPVRRALVAEQERREKAENESARAQAEADQLLQEAKRARSDLETELAARREELLAEARSEADKIRQDTRDQELALAQELDQKREAAMRIQADVFAETLGRVAAASVRRLLEALSGPELDLALTRAVCRELSALPKEQLGACTVETARPLQADASALLSEVLGTGFALHDAPELGAGVRVTTGRGQVDGSALALAREAALQVTARTADAPDEAGAHDPAQG